MNTTVKLDFLAALVALGCSPLVTRQSGDWPDGLDSYRMITRDGVPHQDLDYPQSNGRGNLPLSGRIIGSARVSPR
jgi:hypothetical protein